MIVIGSDTLSKAQATLDAWAARTVVGHWQITVMENPDVGPHRQPVVIDATIRAGDRLLVVRRDCLIVSVHETAGIVVHEMDRLIRDAG